MKSVDEFAKHKNCGKPISVITCYDFWSASIINETDIDAVLVGDSAAMVMHGFSTTVNADVAMMMAHVAAVHKGLQNKFLIADFPFLAHRKSVEHAIECTDKLIKAGANAVKIEGAGSSLEIIKHIADSGVPVMGHLGLTPQSVNQFGGFRLQGKEDDAAIKILNDAKSLEEAGCFSIVLELIPSELAERITHSINIPTIGIGAGPHTSGQVLVLQDMLGLSKEFQPKFLRKYFNGFEVFKNAINNYHLDVTEKKFPNDKESY